MDSKKQKELEAAYLKLNDDFKYIGNDFYGDVEYGVRYIYRPIPSAKIYPHYKSFSDRFLVIKEIKEDMSTVPWYVIFLERNTSEVIPLSEDVFAFYNIGLLNVEGKTYFEFSGALSNYKDEKISSIILTKQCFYLKYKFNEYFIKYIK